MEPQLRASLIEWLRADPALVGKLNAIAEEAPVRASIPWLGIAASASVDWSTKDRKGREVRVAVELNLRGDDPATGARTMALIEDRIEALPTDQSGFKVAGIQFLRARAEQRPANVRAVLLEYRFRLLDDPTD